MCRDEKSISGIVAKIYLNFKKKKSDAMELTYNYTYKKRYLKQRKKKKLAADQCFLMSN